MFRTSRWSPARVSLRSFDDSVAAAHLHIGMAAAVAGTVALVGMLYLACTDDARASLFGTSPSATGIINEAFAACALPCDRRRR